MAKILKESLDQLLTTLALDLDRFVTSYKKDKEITKAATKTKIDKYLNKMITISNDIKTDINNNDLIPDTLIYDGYLLRLSTLANDAITEGNGFWGEKDLIPLGNALYSKSQTLAIVKNEFIKELDKQEATKLKQAEEEKSKIKQQEEKEQSIALQKTLDEVLQRVTKLEETNTNLSSQIVAYDSNLQKLRNLFKIVSIEVPDDHYDNAVSTLRDLQMGAANTKRLTSSNQASLTSNNTAQTIKSYVPFSDLQDEEFIIEGFDLTLFNDKKKLAIWKDAPENKIAYEKLKLSECVYADMYASIIMLSTLLKKYSSQNAYSHHQPDEKLMTSIKAVLSSLIENWNKPWSFCKENIIVPALTTAPVLLKECLEKITAFDHNNDVLHNNFYTNDNKKKIQALGSIVYYKDLDTASHLLPKIEGVWEKLNNSTKLTQHDSTTNNYTPNAVYN